jgi:hypothetical protein
MKYNQPYGVSDPNAAYINGDPSIGQAGSIPPAASIEFDQREIVNFIIKALLTPDNADLFQLAKAAQTQRVNWAVDSGTANAMVITLDPAPLALTVGLPVHVIKGGSPNTTTTPTVNINGLGPKTLVHFDGSAVNAGELLANCLWCGIYDGTSVRLTTPSTGGGGGASAYYGVDTGTADAMVAAIAGMTAYVVGNRYYILKAAFANTIAAPTLNINSLGPKPIVRNDNLACEAAELKASAVFLFEYDGTSFRILSTSRPSTKTEAEAGVSNNTFISPLTLFQRRTPYFSASGSVAQGIPVGVDTKVINLSTLSGSLFNSGSSFASSAFTCGAKDAGVWMFAGYAAMELLSDSTGGKDYRGAIAVNGATAAFMSNYIKETSTYGLIVTTPLIINAGDVVTLSVFQSTDTTRNIKSTQLVGWRINGAV